MIDQQDTGEILNSRSEWGSNRIPRLMVDPDSAGQERNNHNNIEEVKELDLPGESQGPNQSQGGKRKPEVKVNPSMGVPDSSNQKKRPKLSIKDHFKSL